MPQLPAAPASRRTTVRRHPERGVYEDSAVASILDEALVCHLGVNTEGSPLVIPTTHARVGQTLYVHGSPASHVLRAAARGVEVCVAVTIVDGLVLARSWFHHSINYRSVLIFGTAMLVESREKKLEALQALVEHVAPGRPEATRPPTERELASVVVLALPLAEASAKVRYGAPVDVEDDYVLDVWAGELPLVVTPGAPIRDPRLDAAVTLPDHVAAWRRPGPGQP